MFIYVFDCLMIDSVLLFDLWLLIKVRVILLLNSKNLKEIIMD